MLDTLDFYWFMLVNSVMKMSSYKITYKQRNSSSYRLQNLLTAQDKLFLARLSFAFKWIYNSAISTGTGTCRSFCHYIEFKFWLIKLSLLTSTHFIADGLAAEMNFMIIYSNHTIHF